MSIPNSQTTPPPHKTGSRIDTFGILCDRYKIFYNPISIWIIPQIYPCRQYYLLFFALSYLCPYHRNMKLKKFLPFFVIGGILFASVAYATTLLPFQGGTGISTSTATGNCLKVSQPSTTSSLQYTLGSCGSGGGTTTTFNNISTSTLNIIGGTNVTITSSTAANGAANITINSAGASFPSSTVYLTVSGLGCAQGADLNTGNLVGSTTPASDAAPCINAALAKATSSKPIVILQDGVSAISGIHGPLTGNWGIEGLGGHFNQIAVTSYSITSNVVTLVTNSPNNLNVGQAITLTGFPTSTFLFASGTPYLVKSTGLTSSTFQVAFTHSNVATTTEGGFADTLVGTGFYEISASNSNVIDNTMTYNFCSPQPDSPANCGLNGGIPGANIELKNFVVNGNRGWGQNGVTTCTGDVSDTTTDCTGITGLHIFVYGIAISNVSGVTLDGLTIYNTPTYNSLYTNDSNTRVINSDFYGPPPGTIPPYQFNQDSIHFNGANTNIFIDNDYMSTGDDAIALNAAEGPGPISNVVIENSICSNCFSLLRAYTLEADGHQINNVAVSNYNGTSYNYAGIFGLNDPITPGVQSSIDNFTWSNSRISAPFGFLLDENIGNLTFDNVGLTTPNTVGGGPFLWVSANPITVNSLNVVNSYITTVGGGFDNLFNSANGYFGRGGGSVTVNRMYIDNFNVLYTGGGFIARIPLLTLGGVASGTINNLTMTNVNLSTSSVSALSSGGTINLNGAPYNNYNISSPVTIQPPNTGDSFALNLFNPILAPGHVIGTLFGQGPGQDSGTLNAQSGALYYVASSTVNPSYVIFQTFGDGSPIDIEATSVYSAVGNWGFGYPVSTTTPPAKVSVSGTTYLSGTVTLPLLTNSLLATNGSGNIIATSSAVKINGTSSSTFQIIGDNTTITSTVSGATTTFRFATTSISQFVNDSGYVTSTGKIASLNNSQTTNMSSSAAIQLSTSSFPSSAGVNSIIDFWIKENIPSCGSNPSSATTTIAIFGGGVSSTISTLAGSNDVFVGGTYYLTGRIIMTDSTSSEITIIYPIQTSGFNSATPTPSTLTLNSPINLNLNLASNPSINVYQTVASGNANNCAVNISSTIYMQ